MVPDWQSQLKGKAKEQLGKYLGDEQTEGEGTAEKKVAEGQRRVSGAAEEVKGRVKSATGEATDDPARQAEGEVEATKGKMTRA